MMLSSKIKVALPTEGVIVRGKGKYHYVYKVLKTYRNSNGQPTNDRISIGRVDEKSGMLIPNNSYWEYFKEEPVEILPSFDSVRAIGATFLIMRILEQLGASRLLETSLGAERAELALAFGNRLKQAARALGIHRFCEILEVCSLKPIVNTVHGVAFAHHVGCRN